MENTKECLLNMHHYNSLFPLDKGTHYCMTVKDNRKSQVTCRNKQTNEYFFH